ncbi:MAG TPA: hypothetical protein VGJ93_05025 [Desulfuromonadaceae bacterium]
MTLKIIKLALIAVLGIASVPLLAPVNSTGFGLARAEDAWKTEMDAICSKTQDSMTMSNEDLKSLVERCDRLKPIIEGLDETLSKVFGKRLQMCRDLYAFVIESRVNETAK